LEPQTEEEQIVFVLSGMGGVGKSEAVLQFLKRYNKDLRKR
jgi:MinD superfamily P-loop ATPase